MKQRIAAAAVVGVTGLLVLLGARRPAAQLPVGGQGPCNYCKAFIDENGEVQQSCPKGSFVGGLTCTIQGSDCVTNGQCESTPP